MGDCMTFPETFDEFAEQYKIVDRKEIYTNGTELIPIFRVRQWLMRDDPVKNKADFVEVVRCKDCKWFSVHNKDGCYRPDLDHHAQITPVYEDDFCSYGAPKERGGEK